MKNKKQHSDEEKTSLTATEKNQESTEKKGKKTKVVKSENKKKTDVKKGKNIWFRLFKYSAFFAALMFTIFTVFFLTTVKSLKDQFPDLSNEAYYQFPETSKVYDDRGDLISEFSEQRREYNAYDEIPQVLKNAFIAAEDKRFFENMGIDFPALTKTMGKNFIFLIKGERSKIRGASTITQQLVKNVFLSSERTIVRKLKEFILSYRITNALDKERILELYLNYIYLGSNSYGVGVASKTYFNKSLDQLTLVESAALAALPKAPSKLDPFVSPTQNRIRRNWVITRMKEEQMISDEDAQHAMDYDIDLHSGKHRNFAWAFTSYIRKTLEEEYGISDHDFLRKNYNIKTTLNSEIQKIAQSALDKQMVNHSIRHGYLGPLGKVDFDDQMSIKNQIIDQVDVGSISFNLAVVKDMSSDFMLIRTIDNESGIISMDSFDMLGKLQSYQKPVNPIESFEEIFEIGDIIEVQKIDQKSDGFDVFKVAQTPRINGGMIVLSAKTGEIKAMIGGYNDIPGTFNRGFQAKRQLGSVIKPFVYGCALNGGLKIDQLFMDDELSYRTNGKIWTPKNHTRVNYGLLTLRVGMEKSFNVTTVKVADELGIKNLVSCIKRFDFIEDIRPDLTLALGSGESSVLKTSAAFASLVNGGKKMKAEAISEICEGDICFDSKFYNNTAELPEENAVEDRSDEDLENDNSDSDEQKNDDTVIDNNTTIDDFSAFQVLSMMNGSSMRPHMVRRANGLTAKFVGKTGTSQDGTDLWFAGITPDYVVLVYAGFDVPASTGREYGATVSYEVFIDFMHQMVENGYIKPETDAEKIKNIMFDSEGALKELTEPEELRIWKIKEVFKPGPGVSRVKINLKNGKRSEKPVFNEHGFSGDIVFEYYRKTDKIPEFEDSEDGEDFDIYAA